MKAFLELVSLEFLDRYVGERLELLRKVDFQVLVPLSHGLADGLELAVEVVVAVAF